MIVGYHTMRVKTALQDYIDDPSRRKACVASIAACKLIPEKFIY